MMVTEALSGFKNDFRAVFFLKFGFVQQQLSTIWLETTIEQQQQHQFLPLRNKCLSCDHIFQLLSIGLKNFPCSLI